MSLLIREFMRKFFPLVLNCFLVICILGVTLIFLFIPTPYVYGGGIGILSVLKFLGYLVALGAIIFSFGLMYTILDIKDELNALNRSLGIMHTLPEIRDELKTLNKNFTNRA